MRGTRRDRRWRALPLALTALLLAATLVAGYARYEFADRDAFAARVASSLQDPQVRAVVADKTVRAISANVAPAAAIAAPLVSHGVAALLGTPPFRRLFARLVAHRHDALTTGGRGFVFDLTAGTGRLLAAVRSLSPRLASAIPRGLETPVVALRPRSFELRTARIVSSLAGLFWPLAALTLVLTAVCAMLARGLAAAVEAVGLLLAAAGALVALLVTLVGDVVVAHGAHALGLDEDTQRDALRALWRALFGDLRTTGLLLLGGGIVLAVLPAGGRVTARAAAAGARLRVLAGSPRPALRRSRAALLVAVGLLFVLTPGLALRAAIVAAGVAAFVLGVAQLGRWVEPGPAPERDRGSSPLFAAAVFVVVVIGVGAAVALVAPAPSTSPAAPAATAACNGSVALCGRRLDEVVFPSTHNSYAAANEPGWYFPNQRLGIDQQLRDGIRGFLIDLHYGVRGARGPVRTPLRGEGSSRNKVAKQLGPAALHLADRLAGRVGAKLSAGPRRVYLCHTLCELGSEPVDDELRIFARFLAAHGREVVLLVVEPYVAPADVERGLRDVGLLDQVAVLHRDEPLPTLGDLIAKNTRLVVFAERDGGEPPWYMPAFDFIQDTPYQATSARELSCRRLRGTADSPLFLVNHWIASFPPSPRRNRAIGGDVLRRRLVRCERERELVPNLVAVDFYERSGVVRLARELNAQASRPPGGGG